MKRPRIIWAAPPAACGVRQRAPLIQWAQEEGGGAPSAEEL